MQPIFPDILPAELLLAMLDMFMADPLIALPAIFSLDIDALLILLIAPIPVALTWLLPMQPMLAGQVQLPGAFKQVQF